MTAVAQHPQLDDAQREAVTSTAARTLVQSVAGSGKTRVIAARIRWMLDHGAAPERIIAITYTTSAARVLQGRVGAKLGYTGTIHAFLLKLLNKHGSRVGFAPGVGIVDAEAADALVLRIRAEQRYRGTEAALQEAMRERRGAVANPSPAQLVVAAYRMRLSRNNTVDFDGIIFHGLSLLKKLDAEEFGYTHCLWDEVQDMSPQFMEIYDAMPVVSRFAAGDRNQSIFSFLGGSVANIDREAARSFVVRCETNYRCAKSICAAATNLVLAGGGTERTLPRPDAPEGRVEVDEFADSDAEVRFIAQTIRQLETEQSCAVLLRTNAACDVVKMALASYSIRVASREHAQQPPDWHMVKALLLALVNPHNEMLCESLLVALRGEEDAEKSRRSAIAAQMSINESCLHLPELETAVQAADYIAAKRPSAASLDRLQDAVAVAGEGASVGDLVVALSEPPKADAVTSGVVVSTYHSAKAQEFQTVFLPQLEEGTLPSNRDAAVPASLEECRRLVYVGITRAQQNLFLSWCRTRQERYGRGAVTERQASRFIAECGIV